MPGTSPEQTMPQKKPVANMTSEEIIQELKDGEHELPARWDLLHIAGRREYLEGVRSGTASEQDKKAAKQQQEIADLFEDHESPTSKLKAELQKIFI